MKTLKNTITLLLACWLGGAAAQGGYGEIRGLIKNTELEVVPFATIKILQGNQLMGGTQADINGKYSYKPLNPGTYDLLVQEPGHQTQPVRSIKVTPNEATYVDVKLNINTLGTIEVTAPPVDHDPTGVDKTMFTKMSMDYKELNALAGYERGNIGKALEQTTSDVVSGSDGEVHFRGGRGSASGYFVDGVRTLGEVHVPGMCIENLTVFSGGVPASYGDVTSGVVVISTKSYFSGIREKNMRVGAMQERIREEKAKKKAEEDEQNRQKEIEAEKRKDAEKGS